MLRVWIKYVVVILDSVAYCQNLKAVYKSLSNSKRTLTSVAKVKQRSIARACEVVLGRCHDNQHQNKITDHSEWQSATEEGI